MNHDAEDETERRVRVCGWTTQVKSGHYVRVKPDPLPLPSLVVHSAAMADALGLSEAEVATERFAKFFSGDMAQVRLLPFSPPIPRPLHLPTVPSQLLRLPGSPFGIRGFFLRSACVAGRVDAGTRNGVMGDAVCAFYHGPGSVPQLSVRQWQRLWRWARHLRWRGKLQSSFTCRPTSPAATLYVSGLSRTRMCERIDASHRSFARAELSSQISHQEKSSLD